MTISGIVQGINPEQTDTNQNNKLSGSSDCAANFIDALCTSIIQQTFKAKYSGLRNTKVIENTSGKKCCLMNELALILKN